MKKRNLEEVQKRWSSLQDQLNESTARLEQLKSQLAQKGAKSNGESQPIAPPLPAEAPPPGPSPPKRKKTDDPQAAPAPPQPAVTEALQAADGKAGASGGGGGGGDHKRGRRKGKVPLAVGPPLSQPQEPAPPQTNPEESSTPATTAPNPPPSSSPSASSSTSPSVRVQPPRQAAPKKTAPPRPSPTKKHQQKAQRSPMKKDGATSTTSTNQPPQVDAAPPSTRALATKANLAVKRPPPQQAGRDAGKEDITEARVPKKSREAPITTTPSHKHGNQGHEPRETGEGGATATAPALVEPPPDGSSAPTAPSKHGEDGDDVAVTVVAMTGKGKGSGNDEEKQQPPKEQQQQEQEQAQEAPQPQQKQPPSQQKQASQPPLPKRPSSQQVQDVGEGGMRPKAALENGRSKKKGVMAPPADLSDKVLYPGLVWLPKIMVAAEGPDHMTLPERISAFVGSPLKERWWEPGALTRYSPSMKGPDITLTSRGPDAFSPAGNHRIPGSWHPPITRPALPTMFDVQASPLRAIRSLQPPRTWPIDLNKPLCPYDLHGTCNDDTCPFLHFSAYSVGAEKADTATTTATTTTTTTPAPTATTTTTTTSMTNGAAAVGATGGGAGAAGAAGGGGAAPESSSMITGKDSFDPWYLILNRLTPSPGYKSSIAHQGLWEHLKKWVGEFWDSNHHQQHSHPVVMKRQTPLLQDKNSLGAGKKGSPPLEATHYLLQSGFLEPPLGSEEETRYYWQRDGESLSSSLKASRVAGVKLAELRRRVEEHREDIEAWLLLAFHTLIESARFRYDDDGDEVVIISRQEVVSWFQAFRREGKSPTAVKPALKILSRALDANPNSAPLWLLYTHVLISAPNLGPEDTLTMLEEAAKRQVTCLEIWSACETFARGILFHLPTLVSFYDRSLLCLSTSGKDFGRVMVPLLLSRTSVLLRGGHVVDGYRSLSSVLPTPLVDLSAFGGGSEGEKKQSFPLKDIKPPKSKKYQCILWLAYTHLLAFGDLPEGITLFSWMDWHELSPRLARLCWGRHHRKQLRAIVRREPDRRSNLMKAFTACFASTKAEPSWVCFEGAHKSPEEEVAWILAWNYFLVEDILTGGTETCPTLRELMIGVKRDGDGQPGKATIPPRVLVGLEEPAVLMTSMSVVWGEELGSHPDAWGMAERLLQQVVGRGPWVGRGEEGMCWSVAMVLLARASRQLRECEGFAVWEVVHGLMEDVWSVLDGLVAGAKGGRRPIPEVDYVGYEQASEEPSPRTVEGVLKDLMALRHAAMTRLGRSLPDEQGTARRHACLRLYRALVAVRVDLAYRGPKEAITTLAEILEKHKGTQWLPADLRAILWTELVHLCLHHLESCGVMGSGRGGGKECNDLLGPMADFVRFVSQGACNLLTAHDSLTAMAEETPSRVLMAVVSGARMAAYDQLIAKDFIEASLGQFWKAGLPHVQSLAVKSLLDLTPPALLGGPLPAIHVLRPIYHLLARFEAAKSLGRGLAEMGSWRARLEERIRSAAAQLMKRHPLVADDAWVHVYHATLVLGMAHAVVGGVREAEGLAEIAMTMQPLASAAWLQLLRMDEAFGSRSNRRKQVEECIERIVVAVPRPLGRTDQEGSKTETVASTK